MKVMNTLNPKADFFAPGLANSTYSIRVSSGWKLSVDLNLTNGSTLIKQKHG